VVAKLLPVCFTPGTFPHRCTGAAGKKRTASQANRLLSQQTTANKAKYKASNSKLSKRPRRPRPPSSPPNTHSQIPTGALPLEGAPVTQISQITLPPHGCHISVLRFYFPAPGSFAAPAPSVSRAGRPAWLPAAPPPRLTVLAPTSAAAAGGAGAGGGPAARPFDWPAFARAAPLERLAEYLESGDLGLAAPLAALGPRCADGRVYRAAVRALGARCVFEPEIWKVRGRRREGRRVAGPGPVCGAVQDGAGWARLGDG
jgi:hypothetical protein